MRYYLWPIMARVHPLQRLIELAIAENRRKHPNFPDAYRPKPSYTDKTSNGLTKCIIDFLNFSGHQAERISSSGRMIDNRKIVTDSMGFMKTIGSTKWIPGTSTSGTADISSVVSTPTRPGLSWKIEVKIGKDRQSDKQKQYQARVQAAGGIYTIAKDFTGFLYDYDAIMSGSYWD